MSTFSVFKDGNATLTAAGTRQQLAPSTPCAKLTITASPNNSGDIVVGSSAVVGASDTTRRGTPLVSGASLTLDIDDLGKVWFDGTNTGDAVSYSYLA